MGKTPNKCSSSEGKNCWIDEVNGKSKSEISSQLNQFEPEPWCLYVSLESALRSWYVFFSFFFFLPQKSLWTGCVVFIGCSGIICALCMRVIHICSAMKTSLCLGCMGDSRKLLRMRHLAVFIHNKVSSKCPSSMDWVWWVWLLNQEHVSGEFWTKIHETSTSEFWTRSRQCRPIQAATRIRYMQNLAEDDIDLERQRAVGGLSFY